MTHDELKRILDELRTLSSETEWVEFKEAKRNIDSDDLGEYFSALCNEANLKNKSCGWLVFGVDDQHKIVGTQYRPRKAELDSLKYEIAGHTTSRITFTDIFELELSEGRVLMFQIPPAPKGLPVAWKGHFYGRDGESIGALNMQEIEQIRNQVKHPDWSAQICEDATIDDLDEEAIIKARAEYKRKNPDKVEDVDGWDNGTFLNKAKLTKQGGITRTAVILLGKDGSERFLSPSVAQITWILRDKDNIEKDYTHFGPPFLLNVEKLFAKIRNLNYRYLPDNTLFPIEITQYDSWVIREALHNCIAHQDYELKGRINVVEKPDELIFANVGSFIPGSLENVIQQDSPPEIYRNPFLANAMVNLNMIDTIGGGIKKMFQTQKNRFFPLPDYDLSEDKVSVKISGKILNENYTRLLIHKTDLNLSTVILLDKVQKGIQINQEEHRYLRKKKLTEGRYPSIYVAARVASVTGEKAKYIKYRGFDDEHYKKMIIAFIKKYGSASRQEVDDLLIKMLPDILNEKQKRAKIHNLLCKMSKEDNTIKNSGSRRYPKWNLI